MTKIATLTDKQKENLYLTYDNTKFCLFCRENFGFTFITAFKDKADLDEVVNKYGLRPCMDQGASMKYMADIGAFTS